MSDKLIVEERSVSDLIPYVNNSRTHNDEQVNQIASSIKEFGFTNPILIDTDQGIIAGHGRLLAGKKLGLTKVPTITLSNLSNAQRKAYIIADNKLALNAGWDLDSLRIEFETLKDLNFDLTLLGFEDEEIDKLLDIESLLPELADGDRDPFQQKTFTLHDEQAQTVDDAITKARTNPLSDTGINENNNGNALSLICDQWLEGKNANG